MVASVQGLALANGTETLGPPNIAIANGSGTVAAGTGLFAGAGTIAVTVPGTPVQALLYWEAQDDKGTMPTESDTITVNGGPVTGQLIGGPTDFFTGLETAAYRADITGMIVSGANSLSITAPASRINNGAGVFVIYDNGSTADIDIRDGDDVAFVNALSPERQVTVPQTFSFAAEAGERVGQLTLFVASVADDRTPPVAVRPTAIDISSGVVTVTYDNALNSNDGPYWDTYVVSVVIPGGATELTVQVQSADNPPRDALPASLVWIGAGLSGPTTPPPPPAGGEGCTPGYWKQTHHFDSWVPTGYATGDSYDAIFGVSSTKHWTLLSALKAKGGGENALARHAVAALLNASSPAVDYYYYTAEVISLVQHAYESGDYEGVKNLLEAQNEEEQNLYGCPLN
jgi:hypothetical protein